jgi:hypothetical protein
MTLLLNEQVRGNFKTSAHTIHKENTDESNSSRYLDLSGLLDDRACRAGEEA